MKRRCGRRAWVVGGLVGWAALAAPVIDHNAGFWRDAYTDASGVSVLFQARHDEFNRAVELEPGETNAHFITTVIAPAGFSGWGSLTLDGAWSDASEVEVTLLDPSDADAAIPSFTDLPYTGAIDLSSLAATSYPSLKVRVDLTEVIVRPVISLMEVRWSPQSEVGLALDLLSATAINSGASFQCRVLFSSSFVNAQNVVAWIKLPDHGSSTLVYPTSVHPDAPYPGQNDQPSFESATLGGLFTGTEITVLGHTVPANSVYWSFATHTAGQTLALTTTLRVKAGTLNGTELRFRAFAVADNAEDVITVERTASAVASQFNRVNLFDTFFRTGGQSYAPYGSTQTLSIGYGTFFGDIVIGRETLYNAVLYEDLTHLLPVIEDGGDGFSLSDFEPAGDGAVFDPAFVPPDGGDPRPAMYWTFPAIPPGQLTNKTFQMAIRDASAIETGITSFTRSGHLVAATDFVLTTNTTINLGIDETPSFSYALGESFGGSTSISSGNDLPSAIVPNGANYTAIHSIQNLGAVDINDILLFNQIPAEAQFASATLAASLNGRTFYSVSTDPTFAAINPPPVDISQLPADLDPVGESYWIPYDDDPPAELSAVTWIVHYIPVLASPFFTTGQPSFASGFVDLTADLTSPCSASTIQNTGFFRVLGKTPFAGPPVEPINLSGSQTDPMNVGPAIPNVNATASFVPPAVVVSPTNQAVFRLVVNNDASAGGAAVDPMVELTWDAVPVNGAPVYLDLALVTGGTIVQGPPSAGTAVIALNDLPGGGQVVVFAHFDLPPNGIANGSSLSVNAEVSWSSPCAPTSLNRQAAATLLTLPALHVLLHPTPVFTAPGGVIELSATATSMGAAPATQAYTIAPVPTNTVFERAFRAADGAPVYFSSTHFPWLSDPSYPNVTEAFISDNYVLGVAHDNGTPTDPADDYWESPWGEETTSIAFKLDDPTLNLFPTPSSQVLSWRIRNDEDAGPGQIDSPVGTLISNQVAILSAELLRTTSNMEYTRISNDPEPVYAVFEGTDDTGSQIANLQPAAVVFGPTTVGEPVSRSFTVRNDGAAAIQFHSVLVPSGFAETGPLLSDAPIGPDDSRTFAVEFNAAAEGTKSGDLLLRFYPQQNSPFTFPISGNAFVEFTTDLFAIGDFVSITHALDDGPSMFVRSGETVEYQWLVRASTGLDFKDVVILGRVPSGTAFRFMSLDDPSSVQGRLYYSETSNTAYADPTHPPPVDIQSVDLNPVGEDIWKDLDLDPPNDLTAVTWLAVFVPTLHSALADTVIAPTSALARLVLDVTPDDICGFSTLTNQAICRIYGKVRPGETEPQPATPGGPFEVSDSEITQQIPSIGTIDFVQPGLVFEHIVNDFGFTREIEVILVISNSSPSLSLENMSMGMSWHLDAGQDVFGNLPLVTRYPPITDFTPDQVLHYEPGWVEVDPGPIAAGNSVEVRLRMVMPPFDSGYALYVSYLEVSGTLSSCDSQFASTSGFTIGQFDQEFALWLFNEVGATNQLEAAASDDPDGDLFNNWEEFVAGTDPFDETEYLRISAIDPAFVTNYVEFVDSHGVVTQEMYQVIGYVLSWPAVSGRMYRLSQSPEIPAQEWFDVPDATTLDSISGSVVVTNLPLIPSRNFRLEAKREQGADEE